MLNLTSKLHIDKICNGLKLLLSNTIFQTVLLYAVLEMCSGRIYVRPISLAFLALFAYWIYKNFCGEIFAKATEELERRLEVVQRNILIYRETNRTMFCAIGSCCLGILAILGQWICGYTVVALAVIFTAIFMSKSCGSFVMINRQTPHNVCNSPDAEFWPEETELNMVYLGAANDLSSHIEEPEDDESLSDEIPSELLIPDDIPEVNESSTDEDQDELYPCVPVKSETSANINEKALVKYSNDTIEFKKGHFKRDSSLSTSSSSEENLSKGLQFPDHTTVDGPKPSVQTADMAISKNEVYQLVSMVGSSQALLAHGGKLMAGLVQGVLSGASAGPVHNTSNSRLATAADSSDSEFEVLEHEDFE